MPTTLKIEQLKRDSIQYCGQGALVGYDFEAKRIYVVPMRCKSWLCPRCRYLKAYKEINKIESGRPERFLTLTCNPKLYQNKKHALIVMKDSWKEMVRLIRKHFGPFEYALVWELTKRGWPHMHIATRGNFIPQRWLSATWERLTGARIVHIIRVRSGAEVARYIGKYLFKDLSRTIALLGHGKLIQYSKKYVQEKNLDDPYKPNDQVKWSWRPEPIEEVCALLQDRGHLELPFDPEQACITFLLCWENDPPGPKAPKWMQPDLNYRSRQDEVKRCPQSAGEGASSAEAASGPSLT